MNRLACRLGSWLIRLGITVSMWGQEHARRRITDKRRKLKGYRLPNKLLVPTRLERKLARRAS